MPVSVESVVGADEEDTGLLREMAVAAQEYVGAFSWCPPITSISLAFGIGGLVAIFLMEFQKKIAQTDDRLWVIIGDVPSAYVVVEPKDRAQEALERYCLLMDDWISAVLTSGDFGNVFPVEAQRTQANAELLRGRLLFIRNEIIPQMSAERRDRQDTIPN